MTIDAQTLEMRYGVGVRGPQPEYRTLDSIRPSLMDPSCSGPDPVYSVAMDVRRIGDDEDLKKRYLLFGVVAYAAGRLGQELVRSQGHVHTIATHSGWSPPEVFEIWEGKAIVYAQQFATGHPGRCFAVSAGPGEKVVVPPGWAHAAINANPGSTMVFGALCDRQYGFDYTDVRAHGGLAWFPVIEPDGSICWKANSRYENSRLQERKSRKYPELDLDPHQSLYAQYRARPESLEWVAQPQRYAELWPSFEP